MFCGICDWYCGGGDPMDIQGGEAASAAIGYALMGLVPMRNVAEGFAEKLVGLCVCKA